MHSHVESSYTGSTYSVPTIIFFDNTLNYRIDFIKGMCSDTLNITEEKVADPIHNLVNNIYQSIYKYSDYLNDTLQLITWLIIKMNYLEPNFKGLNLMSYEIYRSLLKKLIHIEYI